MRRNWVALESKSKNNEQLTQPTLSNLLLLGGDSFLGGRSLLGILLGILLGALLGRLLCVHQAPRSVYLGEMIDNN